MKKPTFSFFHRPGTRKRPLVRFFFPATFFAGLCLGALRAETALDITNPGFEQELSGWSYQFDYDLSRAVAEAARSGSFGVRITDENPTKGGSLESTPLEAIPGGKYEVFFWARTVSGDGSASVALRFLNGDGKALQKEMPRVIVRQTPEWTRFSVTGRAPEDTAAFSIWIRSSPTEMVTVDFDDLECKEVP